MISDKWQMDDETAYAVSLKFLSNRLTEFILSYSSVIFHLPLLIYH